MNTKKKYRIRQTPNLSTDADCNSNTMRDLGSDDMIGVDQIVSEECTNGQKGGSYINVPSIVVPIHFKSCVRQCSSNNPSPSMRPDNTREILKALQASKARAGRDVSQPGLVKLSQ